MSLPTNPTWSPILHPVPSKSVLHWNDPFGTWITHVIHSSVQKLAVASGLIKRVSLSPCNDPDHWWVSLPLRSSLIALCHGGLVIQRPWVDFVFSFWTCCSLCPQPSRGVTQILSTVLLSGPTSTPYPVSMSLFTSGHTMGFTYFFDLISHTRSHSG